MFADPSDYDLRFTEKLEPVKCCVIGWLVKETRKYLRLQGGIDGPLCGITLLSGAVISIKSILQTKNNNSSDLQISEISKNGCT